MDIDRLSVFINNYYAIHAGSNWHEEETLVYNEACRCLAALLKRARIAHERFARQEENEPEQPNDPPLEGPGPRT